MTHVRPRPAALKVMLVDPSLYTAPYDAALTHGLLAAGVQPTWMTRALRPGEREEIAPGSSEALYYRGVDAATWMPRRLRPLVKGCAHVAGTAGLIARVRRARPDVVHLQWLVVPPVDLAAMALIRRCCPVILTVHDSVPYNGQRMPWMQRLGHALPARLAHRVIVHTRAARQALLAHGVAAERVSVIAHGPLSLPASAVAPTTAQAVRDPRWTMVLFGEIKPYKGLDVLVEAVAALPEAARRQLRIVVAGRPRMDIAPVIARIVELGLDHQFEVRPRRLSEEEMAALFAEADGFVFPYRQIDASGVYYLVRSLGKWLIASRVGIFAEDMEGQALGALVAPGDVRALAGALEQAIVRRPQGGAPGAGGTWAEIGRATRALYDEARLEFERQRERRQAWQG